MRHLLRSVAGFLPALLLVGLPADATVGAGSGVRFVDDDASPGGDGRDWATAYRHVQDALAEAARSNGVVTEIRVAGGVYPPDRGLGVTVGDREAAFALRDGLAVRGGYRGLAVSAGEDPDERDVAGFATVLTGDLLGDDGPDFTGRTDNSVHVVTAIDLGDDVVLDGVTVRGGHADGPNFGPSPKSQDQGAGVNVYFAAPTLIDCTFEDNWADNHGALNDHGNATLVRCTFRGNGSGNLGAGLYMHHGAATVATECVFDGNVTTGEGGGVYNKGSRTALLTDCRFTGNQAGQGGGFYGAELTAATLTRCTFRANAAVTGGGMFNKESATIVVDCRFEANTTTGDGGGGVWNEGGSPAFDGCTFDANVGTRGGGLYNGNGNTSRIRRCTFVRNLGYLDGGGMSNDSSRVVIDDCLFDRNVTTGGAFVVGGGMSNYLGSVVVTRCTFVGNVARDGVFVGGGGMYNETEDLDDSLVVACVFRGNTADAGGGMMNFWASPTLVDCVFVGNVANGAGWAVGGALYNEFLSAPTVVNATIVGNTAEHGAGVFTYFGEPRLTNTIVWGNDGPAVTDDGDAATAIAYSVVEGGWPGVGNGAADPRFVDPTTGDYRLRADSPAIDAGHDWAVPDDAADLDADGDVRELVPHDVAGAPRFADDPTRDGGCGVVDLGAYERPGVVLDPRRRGDLDGDGRVDVADLLRLIADFGPCVEGCCVADLDRSGVVDLVDLLRLLQTWT